VNVYEFRRGYGIDGVLVNINFVGYYLSVGSYDVWSLNRWSRMVCKNVLVRLSGYVSLSSCFLTSVLSRGWFKTLIDLRKIVLMSLQYRVMGFKGFVMVTYGPVEFSERGVWTNR
jgi:hypothetical protein